MVPKLLQERPGNLITAAVGKMPAKQRRQAVRIRLAKQIRPVYPAAEQGSEVLDASVVDEPPGTTQEQFKFPTHL